MAQAIPFIIAAASAGSSLMATGQQRAVGEAQAKATEMEAGVARQQAGLEVEALGRETRRQFGELRAAGGQAGLTDSVTFGDVYKQAATAAELDALSLAYQGETRAKGLLTEAKITRAARPSWAQGILQATSAGLQGYSAGGGTFGGGRASGAGAAGASPGYGGTVPGAGAAGSRRAPSTLTTISRRSPGSR